MTLLAASDWNHPAIQTLAHGRLKCHPHHHRLIRIVLLAILLRDYKDHVGTGLQGVLDTGHFRDTKPAVGSSHHRPAIPADDFLHLMYIIRVLTKLKIDVIELRLSLRGSAGCTSACLVRWSASLCWFSSSSCIFIPLQRATCSGI